MATRLRAGLSDKLICVFGFWHLVFELCALNFELVLGT